MFQRIFLACSTVIFRSSLVEEKRKLRYFFRFLSFSSRNITCLFCSVTSTNHQKRVIPFSCCCIAFSFFFSILLLSKISQLSVEMAATTLAEELPFAGVVYDGHLDRTCSNCYKQLIPVRPSSLFHIKLVCSRIYQRRPATPVVFSTTVAKSARNRISNSIGSVTVYHYHIFTIPPQIFLSSLTICLVVRTPWSYFTIVNVSELKKRVDFARAAI